MRLWTQQWWVGVLDVANAGGQDPAREQKTHFRHKKNEGKESHWAHVGTGIAFPPSAGELRASRRCRGHAPARGEGAAAPGSPRPAELKEEEDRDERTRCFTCWRRMRMMQKLGLFFPSSLQQSLQWGEVGGRGEEGLVGGFGADGCCTPFLLGIFWVVETRGEV